MTLRALLGLLAAALAFLSVAAPVAAQPDEQVLYTTKAGDNLYTLAQRYFVRIQDYPQVQRLNRIADPYRISVGRVIRIPRRLLKDEPLVARIVAFRGDVRIVRRAGSASASIEARIAEGDRIVTGANSFVTLRVEDGSTVSLPSQSRVLVQRLRKVLLTGRVERQFALETGRARAVAVPMNETPGDFRISTPVAVSAVRGTEFRIRYDEALRRGATEVIEGEVGVSSGGAVVPVGAGFGTLSTDEGTGAAVPLLPAPALVRPGRVQDEADLQFQIEPLAGAVAYRVQVAQDAGFIDVAGETLSEGPEARLAGLPDGTWFVRVSAIDRNGLEGMPATYSFQRRRLEITATSERRRIGRYREYLFRWTSEGAGTHRYRFQLMKDDPDNVPVIDEPGLAADRFVATDLEPGIYHWRVMTIQHADGAAHSKWSPLQQLTISADE